MEIYQLLLTRKETELRDVRKAETNRNRNRNLQYLECHSKAKRRELAYSRVCPLFQFRKQNKGNGKHFTHILCRDN